MRTAGQVHPNPRGLNAELLQFGTIYGNDQPYGMDVEFKFELPDRTLAIKQARPYVF